MQVPPGVYRCIYMYHDWGKLAVLGDSFSAGGIPFSVFSQITLIKSSSSKVIVLFWSAIRSFS